MFAGLEQNPAYRWAHRHNTLVRGGFHALDQGVPVLRDAPENPWWRGLSPRFRGLFADRGREEAPRLRGRTPGNEGRFRSARGLVFFVLAAVTVALEPWASEVVEPIAGTGWLPPLAPFVGVLTLGLLACCGLAVAGKLWPVSGWVAVALGFVVLAFPQMDGKDSHYHHVLWLAVVLLLAERGDWVRPCSILIGWVYLMPGLSKLAHLPLLLDSGMETTMYRVRDLHDVSRPIPGGDWFAQASTLGTIAIEVAMLGLVCSRWRPWASLAGFSFHMGTWWVLGINFWSLWFLYPILWMRPEGKQVRAAWLFVALCVLGSLAAGGEGWPFSIYPLFSNGR